MTLTRQHVESVVADYIRAWETQDPDLIVTIFTADATYHERAFEAPIANHEGIREYWGSKVVAEQANISCKLLSLYMDGDTAVAEWEATFDDVPQQVRKVMREVAILEFDNGLIRNLREYWASQTVA
ncbi:nuclear transport factor 2 family protein [Nocardia sp. BMG51109]|uniref:nuclear transport factor 2 family protein n=1 Tax=Nocardia sp. BMG51109 TaxID=1056816 RepID=UPI000467D794|nr:nuclear transport factor 2 family protein [Nocardia sp. BMG51109]